MSQISPIKFQEHLQLTQIGINQSSISSYTLTMESDQFICIREKQEETAQVVIIDMANPQTLIRLPISADSVIMNPTAKLIALWLKDTLTLKTSLYQIDLTWKTHNMTEDVVFWKWINVKTIRCRQSDLWRPLSD